MSMPASLGKEFVEKRPFGSLEYPAAAVTRYDLGVFVGSAITITPLPFHVAVPPPMRRHLQ